MEYIPAGIVVLACLAYLIFCMVTSAQCGGW